MAKEIVIGTRDSALALWQTHWVLDKLQKLNPEYTFRVKHIKTQGDKILDVALAKIGDKGLFTKELEVALLNRDIDLAVHSMKDLPTTLPEGLVIGAICERAEPFDVLISHKGYTLATLPQGARVGTSSLRRRAQLLHFRRDLQIEDLRGNLNTRMAKLERLDLDGIVLAAAGVKRMGWEDKISESIPYDICLPAVGQGAIGVEIRENDEEIMNIVNKINHPDSADAIRAERSMMRKLEGGCQIPIGALGLIKDGELTLQGLVASLDGKKLVRSSVTGPRQEAEELGEKLASILLDMGADEILQQVRQETDEDDS
ncbi:hydroxymethylbilane synthase [Calderihabitans maritimus]|uniref:Porphobilinogen deaminase n=1 Tax=Calderihabitans maritimus TaxID=1246530 RepID=A0A1Z5HVP5_9FIRM|nr:hydroxymethylbilane synthase [Calderihabitans maritimus]GAW93602.1 porphobilinogen deaminase [Calderihabitans maritimus]